MNKKKALLSVSDKSNIVEFAKELDGLGYEIISTGGTLKTLIDGGVKAVSISDITGFPECLDGRVKTLHPFVHAGILAKRDIKEHTDTLKDLGIGTIDLVAVNLYPFSKAVARANCTWEEAIENIDIGGPTMLRSAAKNGEQVFVVVDCSDYNSVIEYIKSGKHDLEFMRNLMRKVFAHTAKYDAVISEYLYSKSESKDEFPQDLTVSYTKAGELRYGENPHQMAAHYVKANAQNSSFSGYELLGGKPLSYNNINDVTFALDIVRDYPEPTVAAIKHASPCAIAMADDICTAYKNAHDSDPVSIFGGVIAFNRAVDSATATELVKTFLEVLIAPDYSDEALKILAQKPNLRILRLRGMDKPCAEGMQIRQISGGILCQDSDSLLYKELKCVTKAQVDSTTMKELEFAFRAVKFVRSNAIVIANGGKTLAIAGGQTSRVWAVEQAIARAGDLCKGSVCASDGFFPFSDSVQLLAKAGIKAIIQPGGSVQDDASIQMCNEKNIAMILTGVRHFKH